MTTKETQTAEVRAVTAIRNAAVSDVKGQSLRSTALGAMTELDLLAYGIPQSDIVPTTDITNWLKGDDETSGFVSELGFTGWAVMDKDAVVNSAMQDVMREVTFVAAAAAKKEWFATQDGKPSPHAVITKAGEFYVFTANFPGYDADANSTDRVSFAKALSAARKIFAKPGVTEDQPHDVAAIKKVLTVLANKDGDYTLADLNAPAVDLIPKLYAMSEELMTQYDEARPTKPSEDVAAVA